VTLTPTARGKATLSAAASFDTRVMFHFPNW
jgi:hypothetical protein